MINCSRGDSSSKRRRSAGERRFSVELLVEMENQKGAIAALANRISSLDVDIEKIGVEERDARFGQARLVVAVTDRINLARIIRRMRTVKSVIKVTRVKR